MSKQMQIQLDEKEKARQEYNESIKELVQASQEEDEELEKFRKKIRKRGLIITEAYHCQRCNYVWLPKDFSVKLISDYTTDDGLMNRTGPKACARCKSKYWNSPPKRKTRHTYTYEGSEERYHDMYTSKNLRAAYRRLTRQVAEHDKRIKHLQELAKKSGIILS
jgi:hypothetical protein